LKGRRHLVGPRSFPRGDRFGCACIALVHSGLLQTKTGDPVSRLGRGGNPNDWSDCAKENGRACCRTQGWSYVLARRGAGRGRGISEMVRLTPFSSTGGERAKRGARSWLVIVVRACFRTGKLLRSPVRRRWGHTTQGDQGNGGGSGPSVLNRGGVGTVLLVVTVGGGSEGSRWRLGRTTRNRRPTAPSCN